MNSIYFHVPNQRKNHHQKMTKTLETNITSEKGDEKSPNITNPITMTTVPYKKDKNSLYLLQYQKYFNKKLVIKYNILPNEYTLMNIDNFITAKYCHSLASFKEMLIFNYDEEFLKRFYPKKESLKKIPLFSEFYKSYLKFFCFPTLAELKLNDLIEDMVEKKAKAFYNENYKEDEKEKNQKKINVVIFTNKIRKDISRVNSLTNLSKTTIKNNSISLSNRSSKSLLTIEKLFNELNYEEKIRKNSLTSRSEDKINNINDKTNKNGSKNKVNKNANNTNNIHNVSLNVNSQNCALKNTVILNKMKNKSKTDDYNNLSNKINKYMESSSSGNRKKVKNKIKISLQNKLLDSIPNTNTYSHTNANSILKESKNIINNKQKLKSIQKNIQTILKINSKVNQYKSILAQYAISSTSTNSNTNNNNKIISLDKRANSKSALSKNNKIKEMKNKSIYNNYSNKNNNNNTINKNNILITNINNNNIQNNTNININNNFLKINCNKHYYTNFKITNTISTTNNNSNRNIQKKAIKVIKKPSIRKIKKIKSRNYKSITSDTNTIFISNNEISSKNNSKNNNSSNYYFTTNDKNMNTLTNKFQTSQNSRKKIKRYIRAKNNINYKNNNIPNSNTSNSSNGKVFNYINSKQKNPAYVIASIKKSNTSLSPSLKNLIIKTKGISNYKKNRVIESKNNTQFNNGSHNLSDSQRFVKNLKIVNSG